MTDDRKALERRFHNEMVNIHRRAKTEAGYNATRFLQMVQVQGGLATAHELLRHNTVSEGFTALALKQKLDLTVEALVLREPWRQLFTAEELARAELRLRSTSSARPS